MSNYSARLAPSIVGDLLAQIEGPDGMFALTSSELIFVNDFGMNRINLSSIRRIAKEGNDLVMYGDGGALLRGQISVSDTELRNFFEVVRDRAAGTRMNEARQLIPIDNVSGSTTPPNPANTAANTLSLNKDTSASTSSGSTGLGNPPYMTPPMSPISPGATLPYAEFWARFGALIIDGVITTIITYVALFIFGGGLLGSLGLIFAGLDSNSTELSSAQAAILFSSLFGSFFLLWIGLIAVNWLYHALMESSKTQGTLGKMLVGIKVTDMYGNRIGFGKATGRYFAKSFLSSILLIGYIIAAFSEKRQALHDLLASTLVLKK